MLESEKDQESNDSEKETMTELETKDKQEKYNSLRTRSMSLQPQQVAKKRNEKKSLTCYSTWIDCNFFI